MPNASDGPLPPLPKTITIPTFQVTTTPSGEIQIPATLPFYYAGIGNIWLWYQVDLPILAKYLTPYGMVPVSFGGAGAVAVNFFNAVALYGQGFPGNPGAAGFNETELIIMATAANQAGNVPAMTLADFLVQGDQTKRIGAYRVWVACDSAVAVAAGRQLFFENKFLCPYTYNVPALNNPGVSTYAWTAHDPDNTQLAIYQATASLEGLEPVPANMSEWIDLSWVDGARRVAGSRRNYFGMNQTYFLPAARQGQVTCTAGDSTHPMKADVQALVGGRPCFAIQTYQSPTCIAEASPYWADM